MSDDILIVEDDAMTGSMLKEYLVQADMGAHWVRSAISARAALSQRRFKLAIIDIGLPGEDGLSLVKSVRDQKGMGVLILTGRSDVADRVIGLEFGADDYMVKPVELRELLARIRAIVRRTGDTRTSSGRVFFAGWTLDMNSRQLLHTDGQEVELTAAEFDLLAAFLAHPQQIMSRNRLLNLTHGHDAGPFDRTIDGLVLRLRRKLGRVGGPSAVRMLKTVHRHGYMLTVPAEQVC